MISPAKSWLIVCYLLFLAMPSFAQEQISIGILTYRPKLQALEQWSALEVALNKAMPEYRFFIGIYSLDELSAKVASRQIDFVLTNPGHYLLMAHRYGMSAPLASLSDIKDGRPLSSFGGVIFTRAERTEIQNLQDLRGKSAAAISANALGGYQMQAYALHLAGLNIPEDIKLITTEGAQDNVVDAVLNGRADAGFVRTGLIESLAAAGKSDSHKIKIINKQNLPDFPYLVSTQLYPEWVFACLRHSDKELMRKVTAFLLNIEENRELAQALGIYGFDVPQDLTPVETVLRELRMPPFDVAPAFTLRDIWMRFQWLILAACIAMIIILLLSFRLLLSNRKLSESEGKLRAILQGSEVAIGWATEDGIIEYINPKFSALFGYTLDDIPNVEQWYLRAYPDAVYRRKIVAHWNGRVDNALAGKTTIERMEVCITGKDGSNHDVVLLGSWVGTRLLVVFNDITERKEAENALRESEARFRNLAVIAPVVIYRTDVFGRCVYVNDAWKNLTGFEVETALGDGWEASIYHEDRERTYAEWRRAFEAHQVFNAEYRIIASDGAIKYVLGRAAANYDDENVLQGYVGTLTDITEHKQAEERIRLISRVFESTLEGIIITNAERQIIEVNEAFTRITGYSREEIIGKNPRILKSGHQDAAFYASMWKTINTTGHWSGEIWNRCKDNSIYPQWMSISVITNQEGMITHYVGICSDITLLKQHEKQLEHIAHYDALTGIPNRVLLVDRMQQALAQTRREKKLLAICYLDLDGFKSINDGLGHDAGDSVLIKTAERINNNLRGGDTVARLGGDEFVILLLNIESIDDCHSSLTRLLQTIEQPILTKGEPSIVTASIGVTLYPLDDEEPETLLRHADQAMYFVKQTGKNRYRIFDPQHDSQIRIERELRARIEQGLLAQEFELFYQPKVTMKDRRVVGAEALIRWRHPERGLLTPSEFLPIIETSELDVKIGEWVIDTALMHLERWRQQGVVLEVSVNITATHLQSDGFIRSLTSKLSRYPQLNARQLQIEVLETEALADIASVGEIIGGCAALGVRFALDDFGTGYSSLAYLRKLPADTLKIDQSFVRDMLVNKGDLVIVQGVIALAHAFDRITIAEGVETEEHFQALVAMGCDIGQGYGIALPMPAEAFVHWIHSDGACHISRPEQLQHI